MRPSSSTHPPLVYDLWITQTQCLVSRSWSWAGPARGPTTSCSQDSTPVGHMRQNSPIHLHASHAECCLYLTPSAAQEVDLPHILPVLWSSASTYNGKGLLNILHLP